MIDEAITGYFEEAEAAGCPPDQVRNFMDAGICLQPKQLVAAALARQCDRPDGPTEIGYGGARGGGKSAWAISQLAADDCQRHAGLKVLLLRNVATKAREALEDLRAAMLMELPHRYVPTRGVLAFPNGSRLISGHFGSERDIGAYLGIEYDAIAIEEATTLSEGTFHAIKSCCRSSKPGWRPRVYATTNPGGRGHGWFKKRFIDPYREAKEKETRFVPATVDDNLCLQNREDYIKTLESQPGWRARAWRHGDWDVAAGQYFTNYAERHHLIKGPFDPRTAHRWFAAMDYGFSHYTVVLLGCRDGDGNYYIVDEHARRKWLVEQHAPAIHGMLERHGLNVQALEYFCAGSDVFAKQFNAQSVDSEYRLHGITLKSANMDRKGGWARMISLMGDPENGSPVRLRIHERCKMLLAQLPDMVHDPDDPEDVEKIDCNEDGEGGDDAVDCARYLLNYRASTVRVGKLRGF